MVAMHKKDLGLIFLAESNDSYRKFLRCSISTLDWTAEDNRIILGVKGYEHKPSRRQ